MDGLGSVVSSTRTYNFIPLVSAQSSSGKGYHRPPVTSVEHGAKARAEGLGRDTSSLLGLLQLLTLLGKNPGYMDGTTCVNILDFMVRMKGAMPSTCKCSANPWKRAVPLASTEGSSGEPGEPGQVLMAGKGEPKADQKETLKG